MTTVFQTQYNPKINTRAAVEYGDLTVLVEQPGEPAIAPAPLARELKRKLSAFAPGDYVLPVGSPAVMFAAGMALRDLGVRSTNVLIWDKKVQRYFTTTLEV